jgi:hypothetical protein
MVPLFNSKNPDGIVLKMALDSIESVCSFPPNICDKGYTWDPLSGLCIVVLNSTKNFWNAAEACQIIGAELIGFENNKQVIGLLALFNEGDISFSSFKLNTF